MGCNCGDNEYNIRVDNNGSCEPTTPIYNITLGNVGVDGYSPTLDVVDETSSTFKIQVVNKSNTVTSPAIPKIDYITAQLSNKLDTDGNNANLPFKIGNFRILSDGNTRVTNEDVTGYLNIKEIRPRNTAGITIGYTTSGNYPINLITNDKAYYNNVEIATLNDIPTVSNATITLTQGGVTKGIFTLNGSATTIDLDAGGSTISNPLEITDGEVGNGAIYIEAGNTPSQNQILFGRINNGSTFTVPAIMLGAVSNPLSVSDYQLGLKALSLNYNTDILKLDSNNKLTVKEMTGCDSITGGASGLVPAPSAGDENKFLKADGTWDTVGGGGSSYTAGTGIDITNDTISIDTSVVAQLSDIPDVSSFLEASDITTGATNGTIAVDGTDIAVYGLGSAAYTSSSDYATSIQGGKADTAMQPSSNDSITGTKEFTTGTAQFDNGSKLEVRGNQTLYIRGANTNQGVYVGINGRGADSVNNVYVNQLQVKASTSGDVGVLRTQGFDLYDSPYLYNTFSRIGRMDISNGDINLTTETGIELQYNGNEVATVSDIPSTMTGATSLADGASGLVPQPLIADKDKYLCGDGTWKTVSGGSGTTVILRKWSVS